MKGLRRGIRKHTFKPRTRFWRPLDQVWLKDPEQMRSYTRQQQELLYVCVPTNETEVQLASEGRFQQMLVKYIDLRHPKESAFMVHVPLELLRSSDGNKLGAIYHSLGSRAGVADLLLLLPRGAYHGLALELKMPERRPTLRQCEFLSGMRSMDYAACWTDSYLTAEWLVTAYLDLPMRARLPELQPKDIKEGQLHVRYRNREIKTDRPRTRSAAAASNAQAAVDGPAAERKP